MEERGGRSSRMWRAVTDAVQRRGRLAMYTVLLLLFSVGNQVYFKRMTSAMPNYGWYLTQLSTLVYVPFFAMMGGAAIMEKQNAQGGLLQKFLLMGIFDGLAGTLMVLGGCQTSGTMQVLIAQAVIPLTMACSVMFLGKKFHILQHTGAAIIILGIVFAKAASMHSGGNVHDDPIFNGIFFLATVPSAFSSVFKEVAFRGFDGDLDVNVLQFWVAAFQVCVNFLAMPIYTLKLLGPQQVPLSQVMNLVVGGTRCLFFFEDQVVTSCGWPGERTCDHCSRAWVPVFLYLAFNLMYNVYTMLVIKHGSAALSFLVATLRMPLASLAFSSTLIMGEEAKSLGLGDFASLIIIIMGLGVYRYGGRLLKVQMRQEDGAYPSVLPADSPVMPPHSPPSPRSRSSLGEPLMRTEGGEHKKSRWTVLPLVSTGLPVPQPTIVVLRAQRTVPRSAVRVRHDLYRRLGAASPLHSPQLRHLSPGLRSPVLEAGEAPSDDETPKILISGLPLEADPR